MVIPTRFERVAYRLGICRSILLSYGTIGTFNTKAAGRSQGFSPAVATSSEGSACLSNTADLVNHSEIRACDTVTG